MKPPGERQERPTNPTKLMIPCSTAYGCGDEWAAGIYLIKFPIWSEPKAVDLCEHCFLRICEAFPTEFDTEQEPV